MTVNLTDQAAARINELTKAGEFAGKSLRLAIDAGGCSGFEYKFSFSDTPAVDDEVFTHNGAQLIIDKMSLGLLDGAVIDYKTSLMSAQFEISNPNAASGCGCGTSFSLKDV